MLHAEVYSLHCHVVMVDCLISPGSMQPHPVEYHTIKFHKITKQKKKGFDHHLASHNPIPQSKTTFCEWLNG
jgi:hypothetical protein